MKTIFEYLLGKNNNKAFCDEYYIVLPSDNIFFEVQNKYKDRELVVRGTVIRYWLLKTTEIKELITKFSQAEIEKDLKVYEIPQGYDYENIKHALLTGEVKRNAITNPIDLKSLS